MKKQIRRYPGVKEAEEARKSQRHMDDEPDTLETPTGFCPNYDKFDRMGWTPEKALIWCNMD